MLSGIERAGRAGYFNFCRAIIAHPELSTRTQLVLSYFNPAAEPYGHVMVAGVPLVTVAAPGVSWTDEPRVCHAT